MAKPTCSIDGCVKQVNARGLCSTHYDRARAADPDGFRITSKRVDASGIPLPCSVESCSERVHAKMMCKYHYSRARRFGDASDVFDGRVCDWCGSTFRVNERGDRRKRFCCAECRSEFYNEARRRETAKRQLETVLLCKQCGDEFYSEGTLARRYCSDRCRSAWWRENPTGECSTDGCNRPLCARGLCKMHYKRRARELGMMKPEPWDDRRRENYQKRRALKRGADAELIDNAKVFDRDGWMCGICAEAVDPELKWPDPMSVSLDHVVPLAKGGSHTYDNVQCAHLRCNIQKSDSVPSERDAEAA